jgi:uncharacterized protein YbaA (DUF1428 family)
MAYVDGFIVAVPKKNLKAYKKLSTLAGKVWREYGALDYKECVADDVPKGKITSFPRAVKQKPSETVIFAWITYKSRTDRDRINKKVMADPRLSGMGPENSPFDAKRMIYGGFKVFVDI